MRSRDPRPSGPASGGNPRKGRAPIAATWWSQRFTSVLESYGLGARMERGRRYARGGQVLSLEVAAGLLESRVQGSRRSPYRVTVQSKPPTKAQWKAIERVFGERMGWAARLLAGEVPGDLEDGFQEAGVALFPSRWSDLKARCSCPDDEVPCKHIAATLYVFAQRLDGDPWLLLAWRGREREALLETLRPAAMTSPAAMSATPRLCGLPPWWPEGIKACTGEPLGQERRLAVPEAQPPDPPARVLERLGPLDVPDGELPGGGGLMEQLDLLYGALLRAAAQPEDTEASPTDR
jgi:uncharacterized Zn finger protein